MLLCESAKIAAEGLPLGIGELEEPCEVFEPSVVRKRQASPIFRNLKERVRKRRHEIDGGSIRTMDIYPVVVLPMGGYGRE
jgi:hypothetical protein